jgi:hypothetical protein
VDELKVFASKRKKQNLGRGTILVADENRTCKEVRGSFLTSPLGANFDPRGGVVP